MVFPIVVGLAVGIGFVLIFALFSSPVLPRSVSNFSQTSISPISKEDYLAEETVKDSFFGHLFLAKYPSAKATISIDNRSGTNVTKVLLTSTMTRPTQNETIIFSMPVITTPIGNMYGDPIRIGVLCSTSAFNDSSITEILWPPYQRSSQGIADVINATTCAK